MTKSAKLGPRKFSQYLAGVRWIADNDEPGCMDVDEVDGFISTLLLADLFGQDPRKVAEDVVALLANA